MTGFYFFNLNRTVVFPPTERAACPWGILLNSLFIGMNFFCICLSSDLGAIQRRVIFMTSLCRLIIFILLFVFSNFALAVTKNGFDLDDSLIPADKIKRGGPPRDGIPSIDKPEFVGSDKADFLKDKDRVIGFYYKGIAKAYPIKILNWHEVVNDHIDGDAILITYCPLCNSGMVFLTQARDTKFTYGVSGLLYNSDVLLYDRQTGSLWSQILGKSISGKMKGVRLDLLTSSHTTWRHWRSRYPDSKVLSTNTGFRINYKKSPYLEYARSSELMFKVEHKNSAYRNKELVLGLSIGNRHKAYPFKELSQQGLESFDDEFAGQKLRFEWHEKDRTAIAFDAEGKELPAVLAYWFAWYAFFPDTEIFEARE
jgi:Protein of unknown function (DUF3179)